MSHDPGTPVLVAIVTTAADWQRIVTEGWYRIPLRSAPRRMDADLVAFYQTSRCAAQGRGVRWYAPITRVQLVRRCELLPGEPGHPRAGERYWRLELGMLSELPRPVPAARYRRVAFIPTSWRALLTARDLADLWAGAREADPAGLLGVFERTRRTLRDQRQRYGGRPILIVIAMRPARP
jgi:hypothetical protein